MWHGAYVGPNMKPQKRELRNLNGRYHLVDLDVEETVFIGATLSVSVTKLLCQERLEALALVNT